MEDLPTPAPGRITLVFDTTTSALWAEEVALAARIPVELVPAPAEAGAGCDLALVAAGERAGELLARLEDSGVSFRRWG